ncbi:cell division ABC transporter subunit FtsX [Pseudovibrio axinellae]|uniref:Cell division ABC transporter subunit FtsX n=1 Tax=Pseudovibrio axinellae TaxID=989403 RepID=A0A165ZQ30_9HYPH|nr:ABC transporter permease [Pseudovibrio axinellae]KZL20138.1 cell division ABC transporter subunit FtsX [Pseudovibrio axinellae]SEQ23719.1 cell division transport system permease protein [Pseudovibrio axinellae]
MTGAKRATVKARRPDGARAATPKKKAKRPVKKATRPKSSNLRFSLREKTAPIVPPQAISGQALMLVVAIMSFLACLTVGFVAIVNDAANDWTNDLVREVTVQIRPADGVNMLLEIDRTLALVREFPGVGDARALSDEETKGLLQPWLGEGLELEELPIPRLVLVEISDPELLDLPAMKNQIEQDIRAASVDDHRVWNRQLSAMANTAVLAGFGILVLVLFSMVLSVIFATQAAMSGNKDVVEVLHFVGAEIGFIASEFQRHFLWLGLKGGIFGGMMAALSFLIIGFFGGGDISSVSGNQVQALFGSAQVSAIGYLGIVAVVVLVAVLTALTSRLAVHRHLGNMD